MRNVIVTGSGQGIGYAIAQAFDKEGDRVFIFDMSKEVADKAAQSLNNGVAYQVDVTDEPTIEKSIKEITEQYGPIDVLVNNAGIQFISKVEDFPLEKWNQVIGVIQTGTFLMTKHVLPSMKQQKKGRIVTISSAHGEMADPFKSAYVASKFAQIGFAKTVALEAVADGITSNAVLPGPVRTALIENQLAHLAEQDNSTEQEAMEKYITGKMPMNRLLEPSEIADTVIFLASDGASAITGETISVSGGSNA
ncbi:3-hydroxybutyrate dehydrogenase [Mammaliicoccus sciuri]|nr:3-hydroxybutyrate dehydrogenase [Mammaliicoccus sciuri]UXU93838.1 3-hydroxybutyrate dehydrogenase [Mammaliicoccus sciuri]UXV15787.1 3-hydroxybutyrate dehydrogenase [Mammaliicoccus sciuri]UXV24048.1 3-hydroxybutyrate dehydrogenase [Mammaliicoccus sciuri]UXV26830.1 3-hydroxybutyrate dehydrogenase [Mammaliicoccus sciuri]